MKASKILVVVKTYPLESKKYKETVCTAGITENGDWVRIYPITYRFLDKDKKYSKYQWISLKLQKDSGDPRPESNKVNGKIKLLKKIGTEDNWNKRKKLLLKNVRYNFEDLISEARNSNISTSLATFKPSEVLGFKVEKICVSNSRNKSLVRKIPYKLYYIFKDELGKKRRLEITDWEVYQLCRKIIQKYGNKKKVVSRILTQKFFDELVGNRDLYFFFRNNKKMAYQAE